MPPVCKRRTSFTARHKVAVLNAMGNPPDIAKEIREFYPNLSSTGTSYTSRRKLVESWLRNRDMIEAQVKNKKGGEKRKHGQKVSAQYYR